VPRLSRLFDVASKISGVLGEPRPQGTETNDTPAAAAPGQTEEVPVAPVAEDVPDAPAELESPEAVDDAPPAEAAREPAAASASPTTPAEPDAQCAAAVDLARAAALEVAGDAVGEHLGVQAEPGFDGEHVVTHSFAAQQPGYRGWRWAVTVARAEGSDVVTLDEVVLLPGGDALLSPPWVPWADRVQPDDLGPGDLLPPPADDPRLVPSYEDVDAPELPFDLHRDLGLGRARVLSAEGRLDAADRWSAGPAGPDSPMARQAPGRCVSCGFLVLLAGDLGRGFGACANAVAPDDGRVVALLHGCGAHSETVATSPHANTTALAVEHEELELVDVAALPDPPATDEA
jgi:hypothetical protein